MTFVTDRIPNLQSLIPAVTNSLLSVLLAPTCAACSAVLDTPLFSAVCRNCWLAIRPITPPVCDACGDPLARQIQSPIPNLQSPVLLCRHCNGRERLIARARAVGEYDGALRQLIHAFKYEKRRSLAAGLAAFMWQRGQDVLQDADCLIPVPLHPHRERARGFNQARELARHLSGPGLPVVEALVRSRHTLSQVDLAADRRHANVQGAFALRGRWCRPPLKLEGIRAVLIDDVRTTGATLDACAVVLRQGGAAEVRALTAARVVTAGSR